MKPLPRIQGSAVQLPNSKQWGYEIVVSLGEMEPILMVFNNPPFLSRRAALQGLNAKVMEVMRVVLTSLKIPTEDLQFLDLKKNQIVSENEFIK